jgi:hypothetical protein
MLPAGEVVVPPLLAPLAPVLDPLPPPLDPLVPEPDAVEPPPADGDVADVLGAVVVAVGAVVGEGLWVVVGGVAVVEVFVAVVLGALLLADTNSVVPEPEPVSRLAVVAVELVVDVEPDSAVLSWSSAAVRFCSA